ncbi:MAG: hypothetical protein KUG71_02125 [Porticoccaceae bacterium]|nr:hypothetical protein [Porticoccaceae bacterium]
MTAFDSLVTVLDGWFETSLADLPDELSQRVQSDFFPMTWDELIPDQRRSVAQLCDYQNDPNMEANQEYWWNHFLRIDELNQKIGSWERVSAISATELDLKEKHLKELKQELAFMERRAQECPPKHLPPNNESRKTTVDTPQFIAYPRAFSLLENRLNATSGEIAMWVFMGAEDGGLNAYTNANELNPPPEFYFQENLGGDHDFLPLLMACWFAEEGIVNFQPLYRFITGEALIERWKETPGIQAAGFICAKIAESRLQDHHPTHGLTQGTYPGDDSYPPLQSAIFNLADVGRIEAEDFGKINLPTAERDRDLQTAANALARQWKSEHRNGFSKQNIAEELATQNEWRYMLASRIERIIRREW